jgi:hypothetical protein
MTACPSSTLAQPSTSALIQYRYRGFPTTTPKLLATLSARSGMRLLVPG